MELSEAQAMAAPALTIQTRELTGEDIPNRALSGLRTLPAGTIVGLAEALRAGDSNERQLAARLLPESSLGRGEILTQSRLALASERDSLVLRWLVVALGHSRTHAAVADLEALAVHQSDEVRHAVPGSLSMCALDDFDLIAGPLLALAADSDDEVRWSAAFELGEWLTVTEDERVRLRLNELADDPSRDVSEAATRAIDAASE